MRRSQGAGSSWFSQAAGAPRGGHCGVVGEPNTELPLHHLLLCAALAASHADLVSLFAGWRAFQRPKVVNGVPDYRPAAMAGQARELRLYQQRLQAIDPRSWPVAQQVDLQIVRAEMNGLDFDHRVLRRWARKPGVYVTVF